MRALTLAVVLVGYNNVLNVWPPFNGPLYVPLNLGITAALAAVAYGPLQLTSADLGISGSTLGDIVLGMAIAGLLVVPVFAAAAFKPRLVADRRVAGLSGGALAYQVLLRIPLGTAVCEEFAFRGMLFAELRPSGTARAAAVSSLAFGLWHVTATLNALGANRPDAGARGKAWAVGGAVAFTTLAGITLVWLRLYTGGLGAPIALHATLNALATVAAVWSGRRSRALPGAPP